MAAFDDGPFTRRNRYARLAGIVYVTPGEVTAMALRRIRVDGLDVTAAILEMLRGPGFRAGPRAILLDGIAYAGFNLVDVDALYRRTGRPVISITRRRPDYPAIRAALRAYFPDTFRARWRRVRAHRLAPYRTAAGLRYVSQVGCGGADARRLLARTTPEGGWPEPLKVARLLAHADVAPRPKGGTEAGRGRTGPSRRTRRRSGRPPGGAGSGSSVRSSARSGGPRGMRSLRPRRRPPHRKG